MLDCWVKMQTSRQQIFACYGNTEAKKKSCWLLTRLLEILNLSSFQFFLNLIFLHLFLWRVSSRAFIITRRKPIVFLQHFTQEFPSNFPHVFCKVESFFFLYFFFFWPIIIWLNNQITCSTYQWKYLWCDGKSINWDNVARRTKNNKISSP